MSNKYGMQANEIVVQPDGKILVASSSYYDLNVTDNSRFTIIRYNTDGTLDTTFVTGGITALSLGSGIREDIATTLALQPDGKIIAAGYTRLINMSPNSVLVRLKTNGTPDSTFGSNGIVISNQSPSNDYFYAMAIMPNGKIIAAGNVNGATQTQVAQFDTNGKVDSTFGVNGIAGIATPMIVARLELQPDGKMVAGGHIPNTDSMCIVRFQVSGQPDSSFGTNGRAVTLFAYGKINSLTLQVDGKMILIGRRSNLGLNNTQMAIARFKSDGVIDSTFGTNGQVFSLGGIDQGYRVIASPDGKLLVAASKDKGFSYSPPVYGNFALLKYNSNGSLDSTFGKRGVVYTDFAGLNDEAYCAALQPDGKLLMAGFSVQNGKNNIALIRYQGMGLTYYNSIYATAFFDNNLNGTKEASEPYFSQADMLTVKPGVDTISMATNGRFAVETDTGSYTNTVRPYHPYFNVVPAQLATAHNNYFNYDSVAFAVQPIAGKRDVEVHLISLGIARPGFPHRYKIFVRNNGTDTITGDTIQLIKSKRLNFNAAFPSANSVKGDTLLWAFANLKPLDTLGIQLYLTVKAPPTVYIGDTLVSVVTIDSLTNDRVPENDTARLVEITRVSYDPNDKTEFHAGKITSSQVTSGEYLQYTIRFQNTGNDTAFNMYIRDTLDAKLDWGTFRMIYASHNFQLNMTDGSRCLWTFGNIMLVDSNQNEPLSHGYLSFIIKPKSNLVVGNMIKNTAAIYFDYNLPIFTNTEMTTLVADVLPLKLLSFTARPNNKGSLSSGEGRGEVLLNWKTTNEINVDKFEIERSNNGREFSKIGAVKAGQTQYSFIDDFSSPSLLERGGVRFYYRLKMIDKDGQFTYSPVRSLTINNSSLTITIFPNPVKDKLQVQINSDKSMTLQVQVVSMDGKVVQSKVLKVHNGVSMQTLNTSSLQCGIYMLKMITTDNKEQGMSLFEKL